ncbi:MAG: hypothetical protein LBN95_02080, partial [Prevotellaceae bacterium]|nr:hypothetical protein [Prevotellaceae bacterium]
MKKLYFILIAFIVGISSAFAQDTIPQQTAETGIYTKKSAIYQNDKRLSENEVKQLLSANDEALKMYNNARINKVSGTIF